MTALRGWVRAVAPLTSALVICGGLLAAVWWSGHSYGYADGLEAAREAQAPELARARKIAVAEAFSPTGRGRCSVVAGDPSHPKVAPSALCIRIAHGGWYLPAPRDKP